MTSIDCAANAEMLPLKISTSERLEGWAYFAF